MCAARLLRAYNIDFKWQRLAAWINLTEQWPYRVSWIIYYFEEAELIENTASLNSLYQRWVSDTESLWFYINLMFKLYVKVNVKLFCHLLLRGG